MSEIDPEGDLSMLEGRTELDVLLEQVEELLGEGVVSADDALELAAVAGLAQRLGAGPASLTEAQTWLESGGRDLIAEGLDEVDLDDLLERIDNLEEADDYEVEEAVSDFDDLVAAALFAGLADTLRPAARQVAQSIRVVPDPFSFMAETGRQMVRTRAFAEEMGLLDYWLAIVEAGE
ncbi:MAG: hypothetical protein EA397_19885 [Deltaproteobacteria bacterium]|nr:MAG: hypothetical protein EA397_19885 [Deltaproteobacteria bacterium]